METRRKFTEEFKREPVSLATQPTPSREPGLCMFPQDLGRVADLALLVLPLARAQLESGY